MPGDGAGGDGGALGGIRGCNPPVPQLLSKTKARHPALLPCPGLTFLREIGAEQVALSLLGQGLDVYGSRVCDGASKALHLLVALRRVQSEVEICEG